MTRASGPCAAAQDSVSQDSLNIESSSHGPEVRVTLGPLACGVIAFALAAGFTIAAMLTCGASLGLFFAGFFTLTMLLPPLLLTRDAISQQLFIAACAVDGIATVWLFAVASPQISFMQWLACYVLLVAYASLPAGMTICLLRLRLAPLAASALTVVLSLAWLTWPVWLVPHLTGPSAEQTVARLASIHPLFAVNGTLAHLGDWSHWPIAYRSLTTLGQDIAYTLPAGIWPAVATHLMPAILLLFAARFIRRR